MARRRTKSRKFIFLFFVLIIAFLVLYGYKSPYFERNVPIIDIKSQMLWNLQTPLSVKISDDTGIKFIRVSLSSGEKSVTLISKNLKTTEKQIKLSINFPKTEFFNVSDFYTLKIEATDNSYWKFKGNSALVQSKIKVDTKRPELYILDQSYSITQGGSGAVVFKASDENLKRVYIKTNFGKEFTATPFYKNGYYAALVAWPIEQKHFQADVIAEDFANNISRTRIRYYLRSRNYKKSTIALNDKFIDGKITDLVNLYATNPSDFSMLDKFKFINETLRTNNENIIKETTSQMPDEMIENFNLSPFIPLKNAQAVASFGDHRYYYYGKKSNVISESWHMGIDFASVAKAPIITNNDALVVFAKENGIYGKNIILYHKFGLYTLYGHCSDIFIETGEILRKNVVIGNTGTSGLALGDHLHFGVIIQGIEVRPEEWMDKKWMKENIFNILQNSKKIIDK